jgi:hypothetical protein
VADFVTEVTDFFFFFRRIARTKAIRSGKISG